jgi:hypothetical protein
VLHQLIDLAIGLGKAIVAVFVPYPKEDQQRARQPRGKPEDVQKSKLAVFEKVSPGDFEVIPEHGPAISVSATKMVPICQLLNRQ